VSGVRNGSERSIPSPSVAPKAAAVTAARVMSALRFSGGGGGFFFGKREVRGERIFAINPLSDSLVVVETETETGARGEDEDFVRGGGLGLAFGGVGGSSKVVPERLG